MDPDQTAPIGAVFSGSTLFASILYLSVMLGNYLQQTTSSDNIFRSAFFSWDFKGLRINVACPISFTDQKHFESFYQLHIQFWKMG